MKRCGLAKRNKWTLATAAGSQQSAGGRCGGDYLFESITKQNSQQFSLFC
jgi:hypothetical protein